MDNLKPLDFALRTLILVILYFTGLVFYRLYFHPLSHIPGPRLAAVTRYYVFYYDIIKDGTFINHLSELHMKYGPIVRIRPNHVHINDPEFFRTVFSLNTQFTKDPGFYKALGLSDSLGGITDPVKHKRLYAIIAPLFSTKATAMHAPAISEILNQVTENITKHYKDGDVLDIHKICRMITTDTISELCFGRTQCLVQQTNTYPPILRILDDFMDAIVLCTYFPLLKDLAVTIPKLFAKMLAPDYISYRESLAKSISLVKERRRKGITTNSYGVPTIFDILLDQSPQESGQVPTEKELIDQGLLLVAAGTESTSYVISLGIFHVLRNPEILRRMREESSKIKRDESGRFSYKDLAALPYLNAIIKETLRISSAVPGCLPRIVPPQGVYVGNTFIPGGNTVSSSILFIHENPNIFPSPSTFNPERWLGAHATGSSEWLVPFSKGTRMCIGMNLAILEISMCFTTFVTSFDMKLCDSGLGSIAWRDHFAAAFEKGKGVKVYIRPTEEI